MQEKHNAMLAEQEEQRRLDSEMEVERLRALEAYQVTGRIHPRLETSVGNAKYSLRWLKDQLHP